MIYLLKNFHHSMMLFILIGCQSAKKEKAFDKSVVHQEIKSMLNSYHDAMRTGGLTAEFDYLDQSKDFFWVSPGYNSTLDYDSVKAILMSSANLVQSINLSWETLQINPLTAEIANYSGIVRGTMTDTSGLKIPMRIIESGSLIKRADGWKLLSGQSANLETK